MTRATSYRCLAAAALVAGCAKDPDYASTFEGTAPAPDPGPKDWPHGLRVVGNHIEDAAGKTIVLHGVNRSGTEYSCVQSGAFFDGPSNEASVAAIKQWANVNTVRVPLNESCWLGINDAPERTSGAYYKNAIYNYVQWLHKYDLIPILELHWVGPGTAIANRQQPMLDADHAAAFWADVATTFMDDDGVVLEPYNEPFPDGNKDSAAAWACWRDGCTANQYAAGNNTPIGTYQAAGMQAIVDAIRGTGSTHIILLGGVQYSNALTQWLAHMPNDPRAQLGAAWHLYEFNACVSETCWNDAPAAVAAAVPLVATEIGEDDCMGVFVEPLMQWLDGKGAGYLAWSWNAGTACVPATSPGRGGRPWAIVSSYLSPTPNGGYAQAFHDHVAGL
jgi:endoglucanase